MRLIQELIAEKDTPDVFGMDVIWSGLVDGALLDLKPFSAQSSLPPSLIWVQPIR